MCIMGSFRSFAAAQRIIVIFLNRFSTSDNKMSSCVYLRARICTQVRHVRTVYGGRGVVLAPRLCDREQRLFGWYNSIKQIFPATRM